MFYSHEILSNSRYGVATIWLVATVGKANNRKVTRKAIQEVNVPKACEVIIEPGAPLALRLQGNLLYGVSRVFAHQCSYVLSDAEKTQSDMMTFFRAMNTSGTDPKAGKAKRHQITLQDDPNFDPLGVLPRFDLLSASNNLVLLSSQLSNQSLSQFTPRRNRNSPSSDGSPPSIEFQLHLSSQSAGSYHLPSDFGHGISPFPQGLAKNNDMGEFNLFREDEFDNFGGMDIEFDVDGNLITILDQDEPELPPLRESAAYEAQMSQRADTAPRQRLMQQEINLDEEDSALVPEEEVLPDADPFPRRNTSELSKASSTESEDSIRTEVAVAPVRPVRRRRFHSMVDQIDRISRQEFCSWTEGYIRNMDAIRKRPQVASETQARKNAHAFMFDNGIANVGIGGGRPGSNHPLANIFSGVALQARLQGQDSQQHEEKLDADVEQPRGRRRSSTEAFGDNEGRVRRVKQRVHNEPDVRHGSADSFTGILEDDTAPELGMDAAPAMGDHHSSSMMPWGDPSSAVPSSAVRNQGSAQKATAPSPLLGRNRNSVLPSIERHSDRPGSSHGSDDFGGFPSQGSSLVFGSDFGDLSLDPAQKSQSVEGLDIASQEFLEVLMRKAQTNDRVARNKRWVDFTVLAPAEHSKYPKHEAAHAFLHVLSLATKGLISVEQDGRDEQEPFGAIRVGVSISQGDTDWRDDSEDKLA